MWFYWGWFGRSESKGCQCCWNYIFGSCGASSYGSSYVASSLVVYLRIVNFSIDQHFYLFRKPLFLVSFKKIIVLSQLFTTKDLKLNRNLYGKIFLVVFNYIFETFLISFYFYIFFKYVLFIFWKYWLDDKESIMFDK